jgi:hypothetical protein
MIHETISQDNSRKLDEILVWIRGDETNPGFSERLRLVEKLLFGREGNRGLIQEHTIMWRIHVWVLCSFSAGLGVLITLLIQRLSKVL